MIYPASYDIVVLQNSTYKMRITASSSGVPIDLSGYTIDADICYVDNHNIITNFVPSVISASSGIFELTLLPAQTVDFTTGEYRYDVNVTSGSGERYYWLRGNVTVSGTCSRE